uniref:(northern house mosquito) hypothetical protein n=1 Tax=Culex pipiens TaxID=7175 RepID=A0A8D8C7L1_CULPI
MYTCSGLLGTKMVFSIRRTHPVGSSVLDVTSYQVLYAKSFGIAILSLPTAKLEPVQLSLAVGSVDHVQVLSADDPFQIVVLSGDRLRQKVDTVLVATVVKLFLRFRWMVLRCAASLV